MKKSLGLAAALLLIAAISFTTACKKTAPPDTCIGSVPDTLYVGQQGTFISCTQGELKSTLWIWGDGGRGTTDTAYHTYTQPGTYQCSLITSNGTGNTKNFTVVVIRAENNWTFQSASYQSGTAAVVNDTVQTTNFTASNISNVSNLIFAFDTLPTADGNYQVIDAQFGTYGYHTVGVYVSTPSGANYVSTGRDHSVAAVTIVGGKINIALNSTMMVNTAVPSDSSVLTASVRQTQ